MNVDPNHFSCRELKRFLYEYVERDLDEKLLIALDNHCLVCSECESLKDSYEESNKTVYEHITRDRITIPTDLKDSLVEALTGDAGDV
jgi:hypothetical protein